MIIPIDFGFSWSWSSSRVIFCKKRFLLIILRTISCIFRIIIGLYEDMIPIGFGFTRSKVEVTEFTHLKIVFTQYLENCHVTLTPVTFTLWVEWPDNLTISSEGANKNFILNEAAQWSKKKMDAKTGDTLLIQVLVFFFFFFFFFFFLVCLLSFKQEEIIMLNGWENCSLRHV